MSCTWYRLKVKHKNGYIVGYIHVRVQLVREHYKKVSPSVHHRTPGSNIVKDAITILNYKFLWHVQGQITAVCMQIQATIMWLESLSVCSTCTNVWCTVFIKIHNHVGLVIQTCLIHFQLSLALFLWTPRTAVSSQ